MMKLPELTHDEYELFLLMIGYATGAATQHDRKLAIAFLRLSNRLNENNPEFVPYAIPEE